MAHNEHVPFKRTTLAIASAFAVVALLFSLCIHPAAFAQENAGSATVLVYMNGSDLESQAGEASTDIQEMLEAKTGTNVNVVIETLGTSEWQEHGIASDRAQRYLLKDGKLELVDDSLGQLDTTAPETLSDFIGWGTSAYPADRYMLVLWGHGGGSVYGYGYDEHQDEEATLTLDEMKQALDNNANVHFDFIGMDSCMMSSLETCVVLQPYCDYTILSEDFEPGIGWSYNEWLSMLENDPAVSTTELGTAVVDDMVKDVSANIEENGEATLALIDESKVGALYDAWTKFAYANEDTLLSANYSQDMEWEDWMRMTTTGTEHGSMTESVHGHGHGHGYGQEQGEMDVCTDGTCDSYDDGAYDVCPDGSCEIEEQHGGACPDGSCGFGGQPGGGYEDCYGDECGYCEDCGECGDCGDYYTTIADYGVTDISEVASTVQSDEATALVNATKDAIVHYSATEGEEGMSGIGVVLPYGDSETYAELEKVFANCGIDGTYIEWLGSFVDAEGSDDYYDFGYEEMPMAA